MDVSLGFLVVLILILFPGLIFRRLYFYGEFSYQFKSGHNIISLLAISVVPGLINIVLVFPLYNYFFTQVDIGEVIDKFKDINSSEFRLTKSNGTPFNELLNTKVAPFIGFLYLISVLVGLMSGRIVRITKLDTKFRILRFKNIWFYLFNGEHSRFKKNKSLKYKNKKHVFTKADILIDSNNKTYLYSGIVVDYEPQEDNCKMLSSVMLESAERYTLKDDKIVPVKIPGNLLVVDCTSMKNINLTYVYEETKSIFESKIPQIIESLLGLLMVLLIPFFCFQAESINWDIYKAYFGLSWYKKILAYFLVIQIINLFIPFIKVGDVYKYVTFKLILGKLTLLGVMLFFITR